MENQQKELDQAALRRIGELGNALVEAVDSAAHHLKYELVYARLLKEFCRYQPYLDFTKTPEGNRLKKNIEHRFKEKESHQEFRFDHLTTVAGRKKYGKKFLNKMKEWGSIDDARHQECLKVSQDGDLHTYEAEEGRDPLQKALFDYWCIPMPLEIRYGDDNFNIEDNVVPPVRSGFKIFLQWMESRGDAPLVYALYLAEELKLIKKMKGDMAAIDFFLEDFVRVYTTDFQVDRFVRSQGVLFKESMRRHVIRDVVKPLLEFETQLRREMDIINDKDYEEVNSTTSDDLDEEPYDRSLDESGNSYDYAHPDESDDTPSFNTRSLNRFQQSNGKTFDSNNKAKTFSVGFRARNNVSRRQKVNKQEVYWC